MSCGSMVAVSLICMSSFFDTQSDSDEDTIGEADEGDLLQYS